MTSNFCRQKKCRHAPGQWLVVLGVIFTPSILTWGYSRNDVRLAQVSADSYVQPVSAAQHDAFRDCGTMQPSIAARIGDCAAANGSAAIWDGRISGINGDAMWKLVTRMGRRQEVWQDQATGLLWSSRVTPSRNYDNWCLASGTASRNDPAGFCNSAVYQPAFPKAQSECEETEDNSAVSGWCSVMGHYDEAVCVRDGGTWTKNRENYAQGIYSAAKGGMGERSPGPRIRWHLPTLDDFRTAEKDDIRMVMPDMGANGSSWEWSANRFKADPPFSWVFDEVSADYDSSTRAFGFAVRCVGQVETQDRERSTSPRSAEGAAPVPLNSAFATYREVVDWRVVMAQCHRESGTSQKDSWNEMDARKRAHYERCLKTKGGVAWDHDWKKAKFDELHEKMKKCVEARGEHFPEVLAVCRRKLKDSLGNGG